MLIVAHMAKLIERERTAAQRLAMCRAAWESINKRAQPHRDRVAWREYMGARQGWQVARVARINFRG